MHRIIIPENTSTLVHIFEVESDTLQAVRDRISAPNRTIKTQHRDIGSDVSSIPVIQCPWATAIGYNLRLVEYSNSLRSWGPAEQAPKYSASTQTLLLVPSMEGNQIVDLSNLTNHEGAWRWSGRF